MGELTLDEGHVVLPLARDDLIDVLPPGDVPAFAKRFPRRAGEFYLTQQGKIVYASRRGDRTMPVTNKRLTRFAVRLKRHLDIRA